MSILFFGIMLLVTTIAVVIGFPLVFYIKRDREWERNTDRSVAAWHAQ